jgi:hypothetical protein
MDQHLLGHAVAADMGGSDCSLLGSSGVQMGRYARLRADGATEIAGLLTG